VCSSAALLRVSQAIAAQRRKTLLGAQLNNPIGNTPCEGIPQCELRRSRADRLPDPRAAQIIRIRRQYQRALRAVRSRHTSRRRLTSCRSLVRISAAARVKGRGSLRKGHPTHPGCRLVECARAVVRCGTVAAGVRPDDEISRGDRQEVTCPASGVRGQRPWRITRSRTSGYFMRFPRIWGSSAAANRLRTSSGRVPNPSSAP
jgi:hypothetical protein